MDGMNVVDTDPGETVELEAHVIELWGSVAPETRRW